jgi:riboflavin synthase
MFTGIIECLGKIVDIKKENSNIHYYIESEISKDLKIDQSVSHSGVCLTVINLFDKTHVVTAIDETLQKTNLIDWKVSDYINLERCMIMNSRLDGHIVQGHVDLVGKCKKVEDKNGSWVFSFEFPNEEKFSNLIVDKGSICINGVSLTVVDCFDNKFSVAIIPYTYEHTNFKKIKVDTLVNLEFDIIGKYVQKIMSNK